MGVFGSPRRGRLEPIAVIVLPCSWPWDARRASIAEACPQDRPTLLRCGSFEGRRRHPPSSNKSTEAAATMLAPRPCPLRGPGNTTLVLDSTRSRGWFLPGSKQLVIGWDMGMRWILRPRAMHALDYLGRGQWASGGQDPWTADPPGRSTSDVGTARRLPDQVAIPVPRASSCRSPSALDGGDPSSRTRLFTCSSGSWARDSTPRRVADLLMDNRGPFGGIDRSLGRAGGRADLIEGPSFLGSSFPWVFRSP